MITPSADGSVSGRGRTKSEGTKAEMIECSGRVILTLGVVSPAEQRMRNSVAVVSAIDVTVESENELKRSERPTMERRRDSASGQTNKASYGRQHSTLEYPWNARIWPNLRLD